MQWLEPAGPVCGRHQHLGASATSRPAKLKQRGVAQGIPGTQVGQGGAQLVLREQSGSNTAGRPY